MTGSTSTALYRDLHAHPELGFQETRTAGVVAGHLRDLGLDVTEGVGGTGVLGVLANGPGRTVWLRADMDGLPVHEQTGLDYASTATGIGEDGAEVALMHACGHDMHVTWLIGAIERLVSEKAEWSGTVAAIFQPAEELIEGAQAMIDDDLVGRLPAPDIVLGQHVGPLPAGVVSLTAGAAMAGADELEVVLHGKGGHGSRPGSIHRSGARRCGDGGRPPVDRLARGHARGARCGHRRQAAGRHEEQHHPGERIGSDSTSGRSRRPRGSASSDRSSGS